VTDPAVVVVAALMVVAAVVVPWLRVAGDATFRKVFAPWAVVVIVAAVVWAVAVAMAAVWVPAVLVPAAVVAAAGWVLATWRARRLTGGGHGRPAGSLSVTGSVRALAHRDAYQTDHLRYGPVFTASQFGRPVVCVVGLERGQRLLRGHRDQLGPSPLPFTDQVMGGFLRYMDDDTHDRYGPAFRQAMSRSVAEAALPITQRVVGQELAAVTSNPVHPGPAMERIARDTLMAALFGIDPTSPDGLEFAAAHERFARRTLLGGHRRTTGALLDLRRLVAAQRRRLEVGEVGEAGEAGTAGGAGEAGVAGLAGVPGAAGVVCALSEFMAADNGLPDDVCVDNLLFMLRIGAPNLQGLLVWLLQLLAENPEWMDRLGGVDADHELCEAFVLESLRMAQSEYLYRRLTDDVDFDGMRLRRGQLVRLCVWESHQDPAVFGEPEHFTDRFAHRRHPQSEFCPFGLDSHACNSVGVVMMAARVVIQAVASDPAIGLVPAAGLTRQLRHWSHWRPGNDLTWVRQV